MQNGSMKKLKTSKVIKVERPGRADVSEKEALKRMKEFAKRKEFSLPLLEHARLPGRHRTRAWNGLAGDSLYS